MSVKHCFLLPGKKIKSGARLPKQEHLYSCRSIVTVVSDRENEYIGEGKGLHLSGDLKRQWERLHQMLPCQLPTAVVWNKQKSIAVTLLRRRVMLVQWFVH